MEKGTGKAKAENAPRNAGSESHARQADQSSQVHYAVTGRLAPTAAGQAAVQQVNAGESAARQMTASQETSSRSPATAQQARTSCCHHKETPRTAEFQDGLQRRLNRVIGQLNGVKSMIDDNRYCGDVLIQLAAAESAIRSISSVILQDHLETCVTDRVRRGDDSVIDETMKLIKRFVR